MGLFNRLFGRKEKVEESPERLVTGPFDSITIDGTKFQLVNSVDALCVAIEVDGRGVLRFHSLTYGDVLAKLAQKLEKRYGRTSRQYSDIFSSLLLCTGCLWEFPGSYILSLQDPELFSGGKMFGGTPGFDQFGKSGFCPQCGSNESLLVYEHFKTEQISEVDIEAISKYWKEQARVWWQSRQSQEAYCDSCNDSISRGQGYVSDKNTRLICENCIQKYLMTDGLENLKKNPHYYGSALLRKARQFRT